MLPYIHENNTAALQQSICPDSVPPTNGVGQGLGSPARDPFLPPAFLIGSSNINKRKSNKGKLSCPVLEMQIPIKPEHKRKCFMPPYGEED